MNPICPYCSQPSKRLHCSQRGLIYECAPCRAWTPIHKNSPTLRPVGTLANTDLHVLRRTCLNKFDCLWRTGATTREQAKEWMMRVMDKPSWEANVHKFTTEECNKFLSLIPSFPK